jgi:hypothetical protein
MFIRIAQDSMIFLAGSAARSLAGRPGVRRCGDQLASRTLDSILAS